MSSQVPTYDEIRAHAEKRVLKRERFLRRLAIYLLVNLAAWIFFIFCLRSASVLSPAVLLPAIITTIGWGIGLGINGIAVFSDTAAAAVRREQAVQREIEREIQRHSLAEKPKRDQTADLSDNGESDANNQTVTQNISKRPS